MKIILKTVSVALFGLLGLVIAPAAQAQVAVRNPNQPAWGPPTPVNIQYYYVPEIAGYYELATRQYIVQRNGQWVRTEYLPGYDSVNFHPVLIEYTGSQPWSRYNEYRDRYPRGGNPSNGGLPPGQAKKMYKKGYDDRYERRDDDRRYERHDDDHDDDRGKYKNKGKGKKDKD